VRVELIQMCAGWIDNFFAHIWGRATRGPAWRRPPLHRPSRPKRTIREQNIEYLMASQIPKNASLCFREKNILPHKNVTKRKLPPPVASRKWAQFPVPTGTGRLTRPPKIRTPLKTSGGPSANEPSACQLPPVIPKGTRLAPLSSDATPQRRRTLRPSGVSAGRPRSATQTSPASPPRARLRPDHQPVAGSHAVPTEDDHRRRHRSSRFSDSDTLS